MTVDYSKLDPELLKKIKEVEERSPAHKQVQALTKQNALTQLILDAVGQLNSETLRDTELTVEALQELKLAVQSLDKEAPETPDVATPIVKAVDKLTKQLNSKEFSPKIDVSIPEVKVPESNVSVNVDAPDLKGIEKLVKDNLPKAFKEAIAAIPEVEIPEAPDRWDEVLDMLQSIDTGTRMKQPFPSTMKVTNPDGTAINDEIDYATRLDDTADPILYIGKAPVGSSTSSAVWQIAKLDTSSGLIKTWAGSAGFSQVWDDRISLTYS